VSVAPGTPSVAKGLTTQFSATGAYSDSTTAALASGVTWTSSAPSVATVDSTGLATAVAVGTTTISASSAGVSGSATLNVTSPVLQSIAVRPSPATSGVGISRQLKAIGSYSDGATIDLTSTTSWSSSAQSVATVDAAGIATGVALGATTVAAAVGPVTGNTTLTIAPSGWYPGASLLTPVQLTSATPIAGNKVLVAGGYDGQTVHGTTQIYDALADSWSAGGNLTLARSGHTATLLADGTILLAGGGATTGVTATAEVYDPVSHTSSAAGQLAVPRENHTATLLPNGKVLVVAGNSVPGGGPALNSADLYDPATNTWSAAGSLAGIRYFHTATLLPNGRVLVAGGWEPGTGGLFGTPPMHLDTAELYDPATNTWSPAGSMAIGRSNHTATLLADGRVLAVAGAGPGAATTAEFYDPVTNTWSDAPELAAPRMSHTATLLPDGRVLIAGGFHLGFATTTSEIYHPDLVAWSQADNLTFARFDHVAILLPTGAVLVSGGWDNGVVSTSELFW
jgi:hypothetical protein